MNFIETQVLDYPELADRYTALSELYNQKQFHQLTEELVNFINDPETNREDNYLRLYQEFIRLFETKLNQITFVQLLTQIATQHYPSRPYVEEEIQSALEFLGSFVEKRGRLGDEAFLVLSMTISKLKLLAGDVAGAKELLEEGETSLNALQGALPSSHASYYSTATEFHKQQGPADKFYHNALLLLNYTPAEAMPEEEQLTLATDLCLAALVGEGVYNFGEVLATPVLSVLDASPVSWLSDMLRVFHAGDIDGFNALWAANADAIAQQPALSAATEALKEKVTLLCLMALVFARDPHDRIFSFQDVAAATRLPEDQVEWLVMRALSLKLIKGSMDQVDETIRISWVQPRVLDLEQIGELRARIGTWKAKAEQTLLMVEGQAGELFD